MVAKTTKMLNSPWVGTMTKWSNSPLLVVDFHGFYCQHFFGFDTFTAIIMLKSLTLMSPLVLVNI